MKSVTLNRQDFANKVLGCWMGKNIGGTLGAPFEWRRQAGHAVQLPPWLGPTASATFTLRTDHIESARLRGVLELTVDGRPTAMLMPVVLLNGNAQ